MADLELLKTFATVEVRAAKYESDMAALKRKTEGSTKKMQTSWDRIGKSVEKNAAKIRKMGVAVAAVGTAITGSLLLAVRSATKLGDELDKMSLRTGESVEQLSALSFAAQISGSSIQEMENGIRRLSRNMNDFQNGIGEAARAFDKLGVSVTDSSGNLRSASSFIIEVADKFNQLTSSSEQAAVAQEIFGRGGTAMLPLLKQGSAGIKALTDRAAELGLVISTEAATAAALFNDKITEMTSSLRIATAKLGMELIPILQPFIERMTEIIGKLAKWTEENPKLAQSLLKWSLVLGGMLSAGGTLLILAPTLIKVTTALKAMRIAMAALSFSPVVLGIAAIGGAAILAAWQIKRFNKELEILTARELYKRAIDNQAEAMERLADAMRAIADPAKVLTVKLGDQLKTIDRAAAIQAVLADKILVTDEAFAGLVATLGGEGAGGYIGASDAANKITAELKKVIDDTTNSTNDLVKSFREMIKESGVTVGLRGEQAPHTRMPIVREQLIPVPSVSAFRDFWNKIKRLAGLAAIEANQRLLQIDADRLKQTLDRNDAEWAKARDRAVSGHLDETKRKLETTNNYYDLLGRIAENTEKRIAKFRRDISKSVIIDMLEADRERREKDLEASIAHAQMITELWDGVAEAISSSLENMFTDALSGNLKTWEDFFQSLWGIAKREMASFAAVQISEAIRGLLPGGKKPAVVGLRIAASELAIATTALVPATVALSGAAGSLLAAAAILAGTGVIAGGGGGGADLAQAEEALREIERETRAPARQIPKNANVGMTTNSFHTVINITEADLETMSQAKVNALFERKLLPAMFNAAEKGKLNKSLMGR